MGVPTAAICGHISAQEEPPGIYPASSRDTAGCSEFWTAKVALRANSSGAGWFTASSCSCTSYHGYVYVNMTRSTFSNLKQSFVPIWGKKMYIASLESVKASSSLEIPCGDGNKDKVKRFGFRLFVYLMTATMEEKKKRDQFVPQQP